MKDELSYDFEARAAHLPDLTIKHQGGKHPFDVIQVSLEEGSLFINREALRALQRPDYNWARLEAALKALPTDFSELDPKPEC